MKYVSAKLAELVVGEAAKLKETVTKEELDKLSVQLKDLNPLSSTKCIYGQMTGNCFSDRANELILQCAERVYSVRSPFLLFDSAKLNGKPTKVEQRKGKYFSPIEMYITVNKDTKATKALLNYLKGKRKTLKSSDLYKKKK